jgi:hypothetical protein
LTWRYLKKVDWQKLWPAVVECRQQKENGFLLQVLIGGWLVAPPAERPLVNHVENIFFKKFGLSKPVHFLENLKVLIDVEVWQMYPLMLFTWYF